MHSTVYLVIPDNAPDKNGTIQFLLEPYRRQEHAEYQREWYYWDYWYFFNIKTGDDVLSYRDCYFLPDEVPDPSLAAAIITPDRALHDLYSLSDLVSHEVKWNEIIDSLENHIVVVIRIHS